MNNKIFITIVSLIFVFGFIFLAYILINAPPKENAVIPELQTILATDRTKWSPDKKNILVEFSDLQCPACKNFHTYIKNELEATKNKEVDITKKITFVYRHFPLFTIHKNSYAASYAAEAAGKQYKFFEMTDRLFDTQEQWANSANPQEYFVGLAQELGLDINAFKTDMDSPEVKSKVNTDYLSGQQAGVNSTPTFFLNGQRVAVRSFEEFKKLLESLN